MIVIPSKSRNVALWFYILTYMFLIFGYSAESLDWLIKLSIYSYYDAIGVLYGVADFEGLLLWAVLGLVAAIGFFISILKFRFNKIDMI